MLDSVLGPVWDVEVRVELATLPPACVFIPGVDPVVCTGTEEDIVVTVAVVLV